MLPVRVRRYALGLSLLIIAAVGIGQLQRGATLPLGTTLGDLRGEFAAGEVFSIEHYRGDVLVLNVWASWCAPCRQEAPILSALAADGVEVIGLSVEDGPPSALAPKARDMGMTYPVGKGSPALMARLGVTVVPTTYVLDAAGVVVLAQTGVVTRAQLQPVIDGARRAR